MNKDLWADMSLLELPDFFGHDYDDTDWGEDLYDIVEPEIMDVINARTVYFTNCGATQAALIPENDLSLPIIKLPLAGFFEYGKWHDIQNHCKLSVEIFQKAKEEGIASFFAEMVQVTETVDGTPVYLQERVSETEEDDDIDRHPNDNSAWAAHTLKKKYFVTLKERWLAECVDWYGAELTEVFLKFIKEKNINDLHSGNYGYRPCGSPCLFDYCGYNDPGSTNSVLESCKKTLLNLDSPLKSNSENK